MMDVSNGTKGGTHEKNHKANTSIMFPS